MSRDSGAPSIEDENPLRLRHTQLKNDPVSLFSPFKSFALLIAFWRGFQIRATIKLFLARDSGASGICAEGRNCPFSH